MVFINVRLSYCILDYFCNSLRPNSKWHLFNIHKSVFFTNRLGGLNFGNIFPIEGRKLVLMTNNVLLFDGKKRVKSNKKKEIAIYQFGHFNYF